MKLRRHSGEARPYSQAPPTRLRFFQATKQPFRWLPRHGSPLCVGEWLSQHLVKLTAKASVYTTVIVVLILVIEFLHPLQLGK